MTSRYMDERVKQVAITVGILLLVACGVVTVWLGWMKVPGPVGEALGMVVGIMSTPFFLEASFVILGILILMTVNAVQRQRDGDEFVSAEQLAARDAGGSARANAPDGDNPPA